MSPMTPGPPPTPLMTNTPHLVQMSQNNTAHEHNVTMGPPSIQSCFPNTPSSSNLHYPATPVNQGDLDGIEDMIPNLPAEQVNIFLFIFLTSSLKCLCLTPSFMDSDVYGVINTQ